LDTIIAISAGDINGIGPEIIFKALESPAFNDYTFIIFGHYEAIQQWKTHVGSTLSLYKMEHPNDIRSSSVGIWTSIEKPISIHMGKVDRDAGELSLRCIEDAVQWCLSHPQCPLVTAPINKESIHLAGSGYVGHTEMLASLCGVPTDEVMMILTSDRLKVGLATVHIPLKQVAEQISEELLDVKIGMIHKALVNLYKISEPRIDILGLNPHAGDGGVIGSEDNDIITPVIQKHKELGMQLDGPFPADAYFGSGKWQHSDAVIAMYHDQGLIPFKMLAFETGVNVTLGLPIIRTSPDHGTAFDIAGKNYANPQSFIEAIHLAKRLSYH
jgi:4-hydroxythreonine-4-phosphate dehydrogenase